MIMIRLVYDDSRDLSEGLIVEIDGGNQYQVAQVFPAFYHKYGNLFAAAPEMYEALKGVQTVIDDGELIDTPEILNKVFKALAKAKGK
jgi:hypothetical protein